MAAALNVMDNSYVNLEYVYFRYNKATHNGVILNIKDGSVVKMIKSTFQHNHGKNTDKYPYHPEMKCLGNTIHSKECTSVMASYSEADMGSISVTSQSKCTITKSHFLENHGTSLLFVSGGSDLSVQASNVSWNLQMNMLRVDQKSSVDIVETSFKENNLTDVYKYGLSQNMFSVTGSSRLTIKDLIVYRTWVFDRGNIFSIDEGGIVEISHFQVERSVIDLGTILYCKGQSSMTWTRGHFYINRIKAGNLIYSEKCNLYLVDFKIKLNQCFTRGNHIITLINNTFQVREYLSVFIAFGILAAGITSR